MAKANTSISQPCPKEVGFDKMSMSINNVIILQIVYDHF